MRVQANKLWSCHHSELNFSVLNKIRLEYKISGEPKLLKIRDWLTSVLFENVYEQRTVYTINYKKKHFESIEMLSIKFSHSLKEQSPP